MTYTVGFWHAFPGESLTLELYPLSGGEIVNGSDGSVLTEAAPETSPGFYTTTITTTQSGRFLARILRSSAVLYLGQVRLTAAAATAVIDGEPLPGVSVVSLESSALAQLASRRSISVSVPTLCGQELSQPIVQGDSYLSGHGRAIEFSREDFPDLPDGCEVRMTARGVDLPEATFQIAGSIAVATGVKVVKFEPTSLQTRLYSPGKYAFDVEIEFPDGNSATFAGPLATLRVIADVGGGGIGA